MRINDAVHTNNLLAFNFIRKGNLLNFIEKKFLMKINIYYLCGDNVVLQVEYLQFNALLIEYIA